MFYKIALKWAPTFDIKNFVCPLTIFIDFLDIFFVSGFRFTKPLPINAPLENIGRFLLFFSYYLNVETAGYTFAVHSEYIRYTCSMVKKVRQHNVYGDLYYHNF